MRGREVRLRRWVDVRPLAPRTWPYFALEGVRYHGHEVSVHWDLDGTRYGLGRGLTVAVDGKTKSVRCVAR